MSTYVWCEDSSSGFQFWRALFGALYPDIIIETKQSNSKLRKAAENIKDDGNMYYLIMDMFLDNPDVLRETKHLKKVIENKSNVRLIKIRSFEFSLLSFEYLENWVFAENDELKTARSNLLETKKNFVTLVYHLGNAGQLEELNSLLKKCGISNNEKLASRLLYGITRNTGFETDKSKIGYCFINSCCQWAERGDDDICGLDDSRLTYSQKMYQIKIHSDLSEAFKEAGL